MPVVCLFMVFILVFHTGVRPQVVFAHIYKFAADSMCQNLQNTTSPTSFVVFCQLCLHLGQPFGWRKSLVREEAGTVSRVTYGWSCTLVRSGHCVSGPHCPVASQLRHHSPGRLEMYKNSRSHQRSTKGENASYCRAALCCSLRSLLCLS